MDFQILAMHFTSTHQIWTHRTGVEGHDEGTSGTLMIGGRLFLLCLVFGVSLSACLCVCVCVWCLVCVCVYQVCVCVQKPLLM